jgi:hypothetical protein
MNPYNSKLDPSTERGFNIKVFTIILAVILLICYGLYNARDLILGPTIDITSPSHFIETTENTIIIKGVAKNVTFISLNERPISIDTEGNFEEKLLLSTGSNIIKLKGRDRFKKEVVQTLEVYYINASSTEETYPTLE